MVSFCSELFALPYGFLRIGIVDFFLSDACLLNRCMMKINSRERPSCPVNRAERDISPAATYSLFHRGARTLRRSTMSTPRILPACS